MNKLQKLIPQTLLLGLALLALSGCREAHFMTDKTYRAQVHADFEARMAADAGALPALVEIPGQVGNDVGTPAGNDISLAEREALEFLYAYMPLADVTDYPTTYYLEQVRASFRAREEMGWKVPEREFRHFVLPVRVNNENLDSSRVVFYKELKPRVQGLSMADAILEVNHWCHEKMTYQPSDARTSSPLTSVRNALGRCGEQSTFCVAALRSVGIPARQVYTPRWAHTDDNHAWVEAWADGGWHFLGACEPEPVLDLGWFNAPASRAMLMHTKVFGRYDGPEEVVLESPNYTEVNLIDNYAATARADFRVVDAEGRPVEGARVDFCIYNYAEFYPAVSKYTDAEGRTYLSSGLGDLLIWASKDGAYGFAKCSFGTDSDVTIVLDRMAGQAGHDEKTQPGDDTSRHSRLDRESLDIVPPPERVRLPEVTPEQRAENDRRFAREDSIRHAYEATFPTHEDALAFVQRHGYGHQMAFPLVQSRGNWRTLEAFLSGADNHERVDALLSSLSGKDLHDVTLPILMDSYNDTGSVIGPRVENEFLTPYKGYFRQVEAFEDMRTPQDIIRWIRSNITLKDDPKAWDIPMSPRGVHESGLATPRSRGIFFVALARTLGIDARKDPVTGKIQYRTDEQWLDVEFDGNAPAAAASTGTLRLTYKPDKVVDNPGYYRHFTLSRIENGRPHLLSFDEGEVDMGGGTDWAHTFRKGYPLEEGRYMLVSGNRLSSGRVPVTIAFFDIEAGKETVQELVLRSGGEEVPVIGSFNAETPYLPVASTLTEDGDVLESEAQDPVSLISSVGRGYYVLALLEPGKEPTNHVLRDLAAARERLEAWGRPIVLLCSSETAMHRLQVEISEGRYGTLPSTILLGLDSTGKVLSGIEQGVKAGRADAAGTPNRFPMVILTDSFYRVFFFSEGYTIGLGDRLAETIARL